MHTTFHDTTIAHVSKSVARHGFGDPTDWADALRELADLSEEQIDAIAAEGCE